MPSPLVLIVEDFVHAREMYAEYLSHVGFRVVEASNGTEAIDAARKRKPDLILMDLALPQMDGWEATRRLKTSAATKHIPILALTGHALEGHETTARAVGCDAFIRKPCLPDDLVAQIRKHLAATKPAASPSRQAAKTPKRPSRPSVRRAKRPRPR